MSVFGTILRWLIWPLALQEVSGSYGIILRPLTVSLVL